MSFGFKKIVDFSPLSIKNLNDQLYLLWHKVMGGLSEQDLRTGESEKIVQKGLEHIDIGVGSVSGTNLVYNGRANHGTESYSVALPDTLLAVDDDVINRKCFLVMGSMLQADIPLAPGQAYSVGCFINTSDNDVVLTIYCQLTNSSSTAQDILVVNETLNTAEFTKKDFAFTAPSSIKSCYISFSGENAYKVTDIQIKEGEAFSEWTPHQGEVFSSSINISQQSVSISSPNFSLNILDPDNPDPNNPVVTMTAAAGGFNKIVAHAIEINGYQLASLTDNETILYVNPAHTNASDANAGTDMGDPLFTINEAIKRIGRIANQPVTIYLASGTTFREDIDIKGFSNHITFTRYDGTENPIIYVVGTKGVLVDSCPMVSFKYIDFYAFFEGAPDHTAEQCVNYALSFRYSNGEVKGCRFYGHTWEYGVAIEVNFARVALQDYIADNFYLLAVLRYTSTVHVLDGVGSIANGVAAFGGLVTLSGTCPTTSSTLVLEQDFAQVVGTATPTTSTPLTNVQVPGEYTYGATFSGSWADDDIVTLNATNISQGEGLDEKIYSGVFGFDLAQMRADLAGETIKNVYLRLTRINELQLVRDVHLWGCDKTDISGAVPVKNASYDYGFAAVFNGGDVTLDFGLATHVVQELLSEQAGTPNSLLLHDDWFSPLTILGYDQLENQKPILRVCV